MKGVSIAAAMLLVLGASAAFAADEEAGWQSKTDLSYVATSGNSDTSSLGFASLTTRNWIKSNLSIRLDAVKAETTSTEEYFIGTPDDLISIDSTETIAERYLAELRFERKITDKFFWFAGAGWDRNRPAGIDDRYQGFAGVGNTWIAKEGHSWKTDYAVSYTDRTDIIQDPAVDGTSAGLRLSSLYAVSIGKSSEFGNDTYLNFNFDESDDWRMDMTNYFTTTISNHLAFKISLQWLYENMPALTGVPVYDMDPDLGGTVIDVAGIAKDDLDTIFRTSLVITF